METLVDGLIKLIYVYNLGYIDEINYHTVLDNLYELSHLIENLDEYGKQEE